LWITLWILYIYIYILSPFCIPGQREGGRLV
jgi:hypothetical protein